MTHKVLGLWEVIRWLGYWYNCKRGCRHQIHCFYLEVSHGLATAQARNRSHHHYLGKEEVVQTLQEVAVRFPLHLLRRGTKHGWECESVKKKKQLTPNPFLEPKVQIIEQEISKILREQHGGTHLYLKFCRGIIALSHNTFKRLIHMQYLSPTNQSR